MGQGVDKPRGEGESTGGEGLKVVVVGGRQAKRWTTRAGKD